MAAILPFMEEDSDEREAEAEVGQGEQRLGGFGDEGSGDEDEDEIEEPVPKTRRSAGKKRERIWIPNQETNPLQAHVEATHAGLTRFVWNRRLVEDFLASCRFWVEHDREKGYVFKIDPPLPADVVPWKLMGTDTGSKAAGGGIGSRNTFSMIGKGNGKMECPAWDLPAGSSAIGGTCPGAAAGQTVVPLAARRQHLTKDEKFLKVTAPGGEQIPFREAATICSACYAGEGNFGYSENMAASILRYAWTRSLINAGPEGVEEWVSVMVAAITAMQIDLADDQYSEEPIRPFRVHSAGDFFSPDYAAAWMEVANRVYQIDPTIRFWCPTRSWATPGKGRERGFDWPAILRKLHQPNLVVRPSAFHVGDPAPEGLTAEGKPGWARGTTALVGPWADENGNPLRIRVVNPETGKVTEKTLAPGVFHEAFPKAISQGDDDPRAEHNCPVYALKQSEEKGSCGEASCRVCWTRPDVRVNYSLH
jgi:hypothetical protein